VNTKAEQTNFSYGNQKTIDFIVNLIEKGRLPDFIVRYCIRTLIKLRLDEEYAGDPEKQTIKYNQFLSSLKQSLLAIDTDKANEQHYEVDARFYELALGKRKKYSSCYYQGDESIDVAEENMLNLYVERGQFQDGQNILELGCGWGSLTLFLAEKFPNSTITGLSNSTSQRLHILEKAKSLGLTNVKIITNDINEFDINERFDRIVSIEMFEHVRNYQQLFNKISSWLKEDGFLFIHVFCHRYLMYPFISDGSDNWMGKYFFSGGQMPAADTFLYFQEKLNIETRWMNNGQHYEKTSNHWLKNMDDNNLEIMSLFKKIYGEDSKVWFHRWRIFFMSCAELFGYNKGNEWLVGHYLFSKKT
jgi:cyclopropane-fatty-acyl-phospholipid synthase